MKDIPIDPLGSLPMFRASNELSDIYLWNLVSSLHENKFSSICTYNSKHFETSCIWILSSNLNFSWGTVLGLFFFPFLFCCVIYMSAQFHFSCLMLAQVFSSILRQEPPGLKEKNSCNDEQHYSKSQCLQWPKNKNPYFKTERLHRTEQRKGRNTMNFNNSIQKQLDAWLFNTRNNMIRLLVERERVITAIAEAASPARSLGSLR